MKYPELRERIILFCQDASPGVPEEKFDGIISAAEVLEVPSAWRRQLKIGGRLVYPKDGSLFREVKIGESKFESEQYHGFAFVPFVKDAN